MREADALQPLSGRSRYQLPGICSAHAELSDQFLSQDVTQARAPVFQYGFHSSCLHRYALGQLSRPVVTLRYLYACNTGCEDLKESFGCKASESGGYIDG